jgi:hypothetical protein
VCTYLPFPVSSPHPPKSSHTQFALALLSIMVFTPQFWTRGPVDSCVRVLLQRTLARCTPTVIVTPTFDTLLYAPHLVLSHPKHLHSLFSWRFAFLFAPEGFPPTSWCWHVSSRCPWGLTSLLSHCAPRSSVRRTLLTMLFMILPWLYVVVLHRSVELL